MITGPQIKAARMLLGLGQKELAELAGVSVPTVQRMESRSGIVGGGVDTLTRVVEALERAGVELISDNSESRGDGRGVRLIQPGGAYGMDAEPSKGGAE